MNLLKEKWIPVQKAKVKSVIEVSEITNPDIFDLDFVRSDFNASIKNFLIGILQTTFAPKTEAEWASKFKSPPTPEELEKAFNPIIEYFNLFSTSPDQPLFLQDTAIQNEKDCKEWPIQAIFTDGPRQKTIEDGKDFFKRDGAISSVCPSCSAALLYTVQTMAWTGGKGYYTSIRSGNTNILTALAEGNNLWETLWLNVLPKKEMETFGTPGELLFPWTVSYSSHAKYWEQESDSAKKKAEKVKFCFAKPSNSDPCQVYWENPWRLKLIVEKKPTRCDCCGHETPISVKKIFIKGPGTKYDDAWKHPLCPYPEKSLFFANESALEFPSLGAIISETKCTTTYPLKNRSYKSVLFYGASMDGAKYLCWLEKEVSRMDLSKETFDWMMKTRSFFSNKKSGVLDSSLKSCWFSEFALSFGNLDTIVDPYFYSIAQSPDMKQLWFDLLQKKTFCLFDKETAQNVKKGLVIYNRNRMIERIKKFAEKEGLVFNEPSIPRRTFFEQRADDFKISRSFCSSLMKWYNSLNYKKSQKIELALIEDLEKIQGHDLCQDLFNRFVECHPDEKDFIYDNQDMLFDQVAIVTVLLCNLQTPSKISLAKLCWTDEIAKRKILSVKDIATDWPEIRDVVKKAYSLSVLDLFQTIINWK